MVHGIPPGHHGMPWWPGLPPWDSMVTRPTMEDQGGPGHNGIPWWPGLPWDSMVSPATMEFHGNLATMESHGGKPGHHGIPW